MRLPAAATRVPATPHRSLQEGADIGFRGRGPGSPGKAPFDAGTMLDLQRPELALRYHHPFASSGFICQVVEALEAEVQEHLAGNFTAERGIGKTAKEPSDTHC